MDFSRLQRNWQNLGTNDPLWAILSDPTAQGGQWDVDEFFATGRGVCAYLARYLGALGLHVRRERALDFGCGFGRLTQGLAPWFHEVVGIDIAESMLAGAQRHNKHGGRVRYLQNARPDLQLCGDASFDFVLSLIVLQHMRPEYAAGYLREFLRVLRPGGVAFFQLPSEPLVPPAAAVPVTPGARAEPLDAFAGAVSVHPQIVNVVLREWRWLQLRVHNHGRLPWPTAPGPGRVQLAWRFEMGDGIAAAPPALVDLPHDVAAGSEARCLLAVQVPDREHANVLAVRAVQDGRWIETAAWPTCRQPVAIAPAPALAMAAPPPRPAPQPFRAGAAEAADEMHIEVWATPVAAVVAAVEAAGGEVVDVGEDDWAGPDWLSAHYTVRKR